MSLTLRGVPIQIVEEGDTVTDLYGNEATVERDHIVMTKEGYATTRNVYDKIKERFQEDGVEE